MKRFVTMMLVLLIFAMPLSTQAAEGPTIVDNNEVPVYVATTGPTALPNAAEGLDLLYAYAFFSSDGYLSIYGETTSNRPTISAGLVAQIRIMDSDGNELGNNEINSVTEYVSPDRRVPFQGSVQLAAFDATQPGWSEGLTVQAAFCDFTYYGGDPETNQKVEATITNLSVRSPYVYYDAKVTNTSEVPLDGMGVAAAFYRADGLYIGGSSTIEQVGSGAIEPGRFDVTSTFSYPNGPLSELAKTDVSASLLVFTASTRSDIGGGQCGPQEIPLPVTFVESAADIPTEPVEVASPAA